MLKRNQLGVIFNAYQGKYKRVLTVCSAGCLRSPTAAHILSSEPWNFNTRCAGTSEEYAIIPVTEALVAWADIILVMESDMVKHINDIQNKMAEEASVMFDYQYKQVVNLDIPDNFDYRNPKLVKMLTEKFQELFPIDELVKVQISYTDSTSEVKYFRSKDAAEWHIRTAGDHVNKVDYL